MLCEYNYKYVIQFYFYVILTMQYPITENYILFRMNYLKVINNKYGFLVYPITLNDNLQ